MFLMDIAQSDDVDQLLHDLNMLKDDALERWMWLFGPVTPPYPTYAMPYDGRQQMEAFKLSPP